MTLPFSSKYHQLTHYDENSGLGIGTTPLALHTHGINTTIVEIDPVVHEFAVKYFSFPAEINAKLVDAIAYTADLVEEGVEKFDYIVHDVFTGGAEPVELFTVEFISTLKALLKPDGVVAIVCFLFLYISLPLSQESFFPFMKSHNPYFIHRSRPTICFQ